MSSWVLYDDPAAAALRPFTWLRPASALLLGAETTWTRWERLLEADRLQIACRPELAPLGPMRTPWSVAAGKAGEHEVWTSDLYLPDQSGIEALRRLSPDEVACFNGRLVAFRPGAHLRPILARPSDEQRNEERARSLEEIAASASKVLELHSGHLLGGLADLLRVHEELLPLDLERRIGASAKSCEPGDGFVYGRERIWIGSDCRIDHGAVLDGREGPVVLEDGVWVSPHTWIQGPFYAARGSRLLGGRLGGGTSLGPECRVRGEVEASIFLGYTNKAHDGFIGHSYVGEWVNLGALTTTSDLKNNYSPVSLEVDGKVIPTGLRKVGSFLGDHVKTRIGCRLGSGCVVGVGANLVGEPAAPGRWVADFVWGAGSQAREYELNKFLETAEIVLGRRRVPWTGEVEAALQRVHEETREPRRRQLGREASGAGSNARST